MAIDEEMGRTMQEIAQCRAVVPSGVAADVLEQNVGLFAAEAQHLGEYPADIARVDIAVDSAQGGDGGQTVCNVDAADVARVPDFIARPEMFGIAVVPIAVGVG